MRRQFIAAERVTAARLSGTTEGDFREAGISAGRELISTFKFMQNTAHNPIQARKCNWFLTGVAAALIKETQFNFELPPPGQKGEPCTES